MIVKIAVMKMEVVKRCNLHSSTYIYIYSLFVMIKSKVYQLNYTIDRNNIYFSVTIKIGLATKLSSSRSACVSSPRQQFLENLEFL